MNAFKPATNVERRKKFIEKLKKNGNYDYFKKKKAEHEKARRKRLKDSIAKLSQSEQNKALLKNRIKCRQRAKKCREKKIQAQDPELQKSSSSSEPLSEPNLPKQCNTSVKFENSYRTEGALAKAATKSWKTLPLSPSKRKAVIAKMLYRLDNEAQQVIIQNKTTLKKGGNKPISSTLTEVIREFYERDDISRMSPNVKDARYFVDPKTGQKQLTQIRHLVVTLKQAHELFKGEHIGEPIVKLAKFSALRPQHVKLVGCTPQNSCVCVYHANFIESCTVLHKHLPSFPSYGPGLMELLVCCEFNKDCWFKKCTSCGPKKIEEKLREMVEESGKGEIKVSWMQWKTDKVKKRTQQEKEHKPLKKLLEYFISIYKQFLKHSFTKTEQSNEFNIDQEYVKSKNNPSECLLRVDFAENHPCESQDEGTAAHWNQRQVSLFTVALTYMGELQAKVVVSDNTDHSKNTLVPYIYTILSKLPKDVKVVRLWSDGPNSQFKNRFIAAVILLFEELFSIKLVWNFFPTAHGKGCIDGIGAVAKSKVRRLVKSRKFVVNCAKDFVTAFNSEKSAIELIELSSEDITKIYNDLSLDGVFKEAKPIENIFNCHQLQSADNKVTGFLTSKDGYALNPKYSTSHQQNKRLKNSNVEK